MGVVHQIMLVGVMPLGHTGGVVPAGHAGVCEPGMYFALSPLQHRQGNSRRQER